MSSIASTKLDADRVEPRELVSPAAVVERTYPHVYCNVHGDERVGGRGSASTGTFSRDTRGVVRSDMVLIDIASGKQITAIPHRSTFEAVRTRLTPDEFSGVVDRINELIDGAGKEIVTAGWLPGSNWYGTPFWPIYEKAAGRNQDLAGRMFGLMVWYTVKERDEYWASGRFEKDGKEIGSRTYFKVDPK